DLVEGALDPGRAPTTVEDDEVSGAPPGWMPALTERDRYEWCHGDRDDPIEGLASFCDHVGLPVSDLTAGATRGDRRYGVGLLIGAAACAAAAGADPGPPSPCRAVPDAAAVVFDLSNEPVPVPVRRPLLRLEEWRGAWARPAPNASSGS